MIDVELASCITNSPLLHRQRKTEREGGRETLRGYDRERKVREDEERSSTQLIKVEDSGISLLRRFFVLHPSFPLPVPLLPLCSLHILQGRWPGRGH